MSSKFETGQLSFHETMDPHSRDIVVDDHVVGSFRLDGHKVVTLNSFDEPYITIPLSVVRTIIAEREWLLNENHQVVVSSQAYGDITFWSQADSTEIFIDGQPVGLLRFENRLQPHADIFFYSSFKGRTMPMIQIDMWALYAILAEYKKGRH